MASENGVLAKLAEIRHSFLAGVEDARKQFAIKIKEVREEYLNQVVDVTLGDPRLSEVEKALGSWRTPVRVISSATQSPPPVPSEVPPAVAVTVAPPEKQLLKSYRLVVYGHCPSCNAAIFEAEAKFCSQCAYPLEE